MAYQAKIESAEAADKMCAVSHARMYLENFIQNQKVIINNDKTSNKTITRCDHARSQ